MTDEGSKIPQSKDDLEQAFGDQLANLQDAVGLFDAGDDRRAAKQIALYLRILLHDHRQSKALIRTVGRRPTNFFSTAMPLNDANVMTHGGLIVIEHGSWGARYAAALDDFIFSQWMPFDRWWTEIVFKDDRSDMLSRRQLVLTVADQDGGAHVDTALDPVYARLSRGNSLGWRRYVNGQDEALENPTPGALRQVAHEVLRTVIPAYRKKPARDGVQFISGHAMMNEGPTAAAIPLQTHYSRNDPCPCGGGRKWKKCHGAVA